LVLRSGSGRCCEYDIRAISIITGDHFSDTTPCSEIFGCFFACEASANVPAQGAALDDGRQLQEAARPARLFMIVGHVESSFVPECSTSRAQKALTLTRN
jgi:hypothetical protein